MARLVIGAELKVLITKQSTPALLADALPLLRTGPVHASWVQFTLITIRSLVSAFASVREKGEDETENKKR